MLLLLVLCGKLLEETYLEAPGVFKEIILKCLRSRFVKIGIGFK
jgi:hypothetical protein